MKRLLRRYSYGVVTVVLAATVGAVCLFGGKEGPDRPEPISAEETLTLPVFLPEAPSAPEEEPIAPELVGVWVPYFSLETEEHTRAAFEENFRRIAASAKEKGANALFVHVRPFCDALYPSRYFPWSHILTGEQGRDPGWDPMAFLVEHTHSLGMAFHAWVNPLRVKTASTPERSSPTGLFEILREDSPYYFMEWEGGVYLDPAWPYVRGLIADGAAELVERYGVDGVHFDDYFYPAESEELDREAYGLYVQSVETPLPLEEWRRANIDCMVQQVYRKVKAADPEAVFGISPQGNIENDRAMGADVETWCAVPGYVDYLCPQLYYSFENPALGYGEALSRWAALPRDGSVALYVGLALYKAGSSADRGTWQDREDVIARQIRAARAQNCAGIVLYSSEYLDAPQTEQEVKNAMAVLSAPGTG